MLPLQIVQSCYEPRWWAFSTPEGLLWASSRQPFVFHMMHDKPFQNYHHLEIGHITGFPPINVDFGKADGRHALGIVATYYNHKKLFPYTIKESSSTHKIHIWYFNRCGFSISSGLREHTFSFSYLRFPFSVVGVGSGSSPLFLVESSFLSILSISLTSGGPT